jgi:hypothetical protein
VCVCVCVCIHIYVYTYIYIYIYTHVCVYVVESRAFFLFRLLKHFITENFQFSVDGQFVQSICNKKKVQTKKSYPTGSYRRSRPSRRRRSRSMASWCRASARNRASSRTQPRAAQIYRHTCIYIYTHTHTYCSRTRICSVSLYYTHVLDRRVLLMRC